MYNGIGLQTPRGSGTNGYVQRNMAFVFEKPKQMQFNYNTSIQRVAPTTRAPNQDILDHERKRQIEVKVMDWASKAGLLDKDLPEEELEAELSRKREELLREGTSDTTLERDKVHKLQESHARNLRKQQETESFKNALNISDDYQEGAAFDPKIQEQKRQQAQELKLRKILEAEQKKLEEEERKEDDKRRQRKEERRERKEKERLEKGPQGKQDASEPRKGEDKKSVRRDSKSPSPRRRGGRHDSSSPPRGRRHDSESPSPKKRRHDSVSPKKGRHDSESPSPRRTRRDSSSPRVRRHDSKSPSPPGRRASP